MDLAEAIGPDCEKRVIGIRPGEKIHEEMITSSDSKNTVDLGAYFAILPSVKASQPRGKPFPVDEAYSSGTNEEFLSVQALRDLIVRHVDPSFQP